MSDIIINNIKIGSAYPVYFIADIAANHDGNLHRAKDLIRIAKLSGADAVKFQHHDVRKYVSDKGFKDLGGKFSHQTKWDKSIFDVYKDAEVPLSWTNELKDYCNELNITFFTTPYDLDMVDKVDKFVPAYKIGSGDVTWNSMLQKIASKGKPVLFASGASDICDVVNAYQNINDINPNIILMQCNTNYTASDNNFDYINLNVLKTYKLLFPSAVLGNNFDYINLNVLKTYKLLFPSAVLGLSDHTHGHETVLGAVSLGAKVIEKHFTDDTSRPGPDHPFSMDPNTWSSMVKSTRLLERSLGSTIKKIEDNEKETVILQRRAIRLKKTQRAGETFEINMVEYQRPCPPDAVMPNNISYILGKKFKREVVKGDYVKIEDFM